MESFRGSLFISFLPCAAAGRAAFDREGCRRRRGAHPFVTKFLRNIVFTGTAVKIDTGNQGNEKMFRSRISRKVKKSPKVVKKENTRPATKQGNVWKTDSSFQQDRFQPHNVTESKKNRDRGLFFSKNGAFSFRTQKNKHIFSYALYIFKARASSMLKVLKKGL